MDGAVSGCWRGLGGRTSGFSWERTRAETCRVLCGRRSGRREAKGRRGRCIMVEYGDVYKSHSGKIHSVITKIILSLVRHSPIISRLPLLPRHQTPRAPHQTPSPRHRSLRARHPPRHSFNAKLHTRPHDPLAARTPPHRPSANPQIHIPTSRFARLFSCTHITRPHKISLHISWNDNTSPEKHG